MKLFKVKVDFRGVTCRQAGRLISLAKLGFSSITCSCSVLAEAKAMEGKLAEVL
jgi:hypothetical protein